MEINLETLGYRDFFKAGNEKDREAARVIDDASDGYQVINEKGQLKAKLSEELQFIATDPADFPAVGDWVLISRDKEKGIIHKILTRHSLLERRDTAEQDRRQILGANIDTAFIMIPLDGEFDIDPIEHYLAMVNMGRIRPVILLTKADLLERAELHQRVAAVQDRTRVADVIQVSIHTGKGLDILEKQIFRGNTYSLLGPSGAGKTALIHHLLNRASGDYGAGKKKSGNNKRPYFSDKFFLLPQGGVLIDIPDLRKMVPGRKSVDMEVTFPEIEKLSLACRTQHCSHTDEAGCAVQDAVRKGKVAEEDLKAYRKLHRRAVDPR